MQAAKVASLRKDNAKLKKRNKKLKKQAKIAALKRKQDDDSSVSSHGSDTSVWRE